MNIIFHSLRVTLILCILSGVCFCSLVYAETLTVSLVVLSKGQCRLTNNSATLDFGSLNPLNSQDVTVDTGDQLSFSCNGNGNENVTFSISIINSLHGTAAAPRMQHEGGADYIPYELRISPTFGSTPPRRGQMPPVPLVVTGTILSSNYQFAPVGYYEDTVTLSISP